MIDVEKILRKRKPKGVDLARLEIARLMDEYAQTNLDAVNGQLEELPDNIRHYFDQPHNLGKVTPDALEKIKIRYQQNATQEDRIAYAAYKTMYAWINHAQGNAQMHTQRAAASFNHLYHALLDGVTAENIYRYEASLPAIMTKIQYEEYLEYKEDTRATLNGIAVIEEDSILGGEENPRIDGRGYYNPPHSCKEIADMIGLQKYIDREGAGYVTLQNRKNLIESLKFTYGINKIIEIAAEVFDIEDLLIAQVDITVTETHFTAYNSIRGALGTILKNSQNYQTAEIKKEKQELLDQILPPLSFEVFQTEKRQIEKGKKLMREFIKTGTNLFNYSNNTLINLFCV